MVQQEKLVLVVPVLMQPKILHSLLVQEIRLPWIPVFGTAIAYEVEPTFIDGEHWRDAGYDTKFDRDREGYRDHWEVNMASTTRYNFVIAKATHRATTTPGNKAASLAISRMPHRSGKRPHLMPIQYRCHQNDPRRLWSHHQRPFPPSHYWRNR